MPVEPTARSERLLDLGGLHLSFPIPRRAMSLCSIPQASAVVLCIYCSVKEMGNAAEKEISL